MNDPMLRCIQPIPKEWEAVKLSEFMFYQEGPGLTSDLFDDEGMPFLNIRCIVGSDIIKEKCRFVNMAIAESCYKQFMLQEGDIVFSSSGTIGKIAFVSSEHLPLMLNTSIIRFRTLNEEKLIKAYIPIFLNSPDFVKQYTHQAQGSAQVNIGPTHLDKMYIALPPVSQQQKIAKILSTVDNLIEKTQSLVDKYTAIKQGMMADLFTRGIDMTTGDHQNPKGGELRPSVGDAPELYKQTELGWVPKEWEVCSLKEKIEADGFVQTGPFGSQLHSYEYVESGVPVVMPQDIIEGVISFEKMAQITEDKANSLSRHKVKANDVIFSRRGDLTRSSYIANELNNIGFICGTGCLLLRVSSLMVHGGWFSTLYGTRFIQSQVDGLAVGTTMANLNSKILGKLLVAFPPVKEQKVIYERIELIDRKLKLFQREVEEHRKIKKGLMQDLLTGKVKVI
jgi:type I restriction enzyme S subunit